jgi:hypothetical protein
MLLRLLLYFLLKKSNSTIAFTSASWDFTKKFYAEFMKIIDNSLVKTTNKNESIELNNGSIVYFYSAGSSILPVGLTVDCLICDEFALYRKDVWDYLRPIVLANKEAKVIVASTPRGKNAFYDMCQLGLKNEGRHRHYRMHYTDNPRIDLQQIEDDRLSMSKQMFDQEYNSEFTDAISGVFGDFKHALSISSWSEPVLNKNYFYGLDVAGVGADKTVLTIIDQQGKINLIYECISGDMVEQAEELAPIIAKYKAAGYVEKNGIGQGLADILKSKHLNVRYFNTTLDSKQRIVSGLILNLNKNEIQLPTEKLCPKLENEMSCFGATRTSTGLIRYAGEDDVHDDYVMSLMMANEARKKLSTGLTIYDDSEIDDPIELSQYVQPIPLVELMKQKTHWSAQLKY